MTANISRQTIDDLMLIIEKYKAMQQVSLEKAQSEIKRANDAAAAFIKELNLE